MGEQKRQLFGTDGIRGVAGEFPLTLESTYLIGRALGHDLVRNTRRAQAVIGQDTRESSGGIAYLARSRGFAAGVVISASHNPWTDNGIKVFSGDGFKLVDEGELAIEKEIFGLLQNPTVADETAQKVPGPCLPGEAELRHAYVGSLVSNVASGLRGLRLLVDCATGATTAEAPE